MTHIRVSVLGPVRVEVDGAEARLTPLTSRLLARLVAAQGEAVPVGDLRHEVWETKETWPRDEQRDRNEVQKRVFELRRIFDPGQTGEGKRVLSFVDKKSAYQLNLNEGQLDAAEFTMLVTRALRESAVAAETMLTRALALWRGLPLDEVGVPDFVNPIRRRLCGLRYTALEELIAIRESLGRPKYALTLAEEVARERPDDPVATATLIRLRRRIREERGGEILRRRLPGSGTDTDLVVVTGDLFEQRDANLVVGFTDTFDVETGVGRAINSESVQGQLLERCFGGDTQALDREVRRALRNVAWESRESRREKRSGKQIRYPVGTTVPIPAGGRLVLATAYSRLDNNLSARSSRDLLRRSLDQLWEQVALHGEYRPVALPMIGTGQARVRDLSWERTVAMIVETFLDGVRTHGPVAPELRIVILPRQMGNIWMPDVVDLLNEIENRGS
jgi:DNA-binding SARP family transcriptional activator